MQSRAFYAIAALAAFAAFATTAARADDADPSQQFAIKFESSRTRAEVMAEAARVPTTRSTEPPGSRISLPLKSTIDVHVLRAQAAQAVRLGQISRGEALPF